jgi:hypothetical protein
MGKIVAVKVLDVAKTGEFDRERFRDRALFAPRNAYERYWTIGPKTLA